MKNITWRWAFLGTIAVGFLAFLGLELKAVFDSDENTDALTTIISAYIPSDVFFIGLAGLCGWLFWHFTKEYFRRGK